MTKRIISSAGIQTFRVSVLAFTMALLGGCVSIQSAARKGDLEEVRSQLASGTNVNSKTFRMGLTALHGAAGNGHIEIVKLLLEKGADIAKVQDWLGHADVSTTRATEACTSTVSCWTSTSPLGTWGEQDWTPTGSPSRPKRPGTTIALCYTSLPRW